MNGAGIVLGGLLTCACAGRGMGIAAGGRLYVFALMLEGLASVHPVSAIENGLAKQPPMGWRSWNLYGARVNQPLLVNIMKGMVSRKRTVDGVPVSLCDLGYCEVGLDDAWQSCSTAMQGEHYHDQQGNPIVNRSKFPDLHALTATAHSMNLTAGWYLNNCICREEKTANRAMYEGDVKALRAFDFDAVKLDACGTQLDLDLWQQLLAKSGRPVNVEACHWGRFRPNKTWCPASFFRTSGDIRAKYGSMLSNLLTTVKWAVDGVSRPGCWAYPDMLEVGCQNGPGGEHDPGLSFVEMRSHFGAWCIVSSPLILSHDVNNDAVMDAVWPVISNAEAIAINQVWAGHSGSPFQESPAKIKVPGHADQTKEAILGDKGAAPGTETPVPSWHYFHKPLGRGRVAVLLMNHDSAAADLTVDFHKVPGIHTPRVCLRDVWARKNIGVYENKTTWRAVAPHDSVFLVVETERGNNCSGPPKFVDTLGNNGHAFCSAYCAFNMNGELSDFGWTGACCVTAILPSGEEVSCTRTFAKQGRVVCRCARDDHHPFLPRKDWTTTDTRYLCAAPGDGAAKAEAIFVGGFASVLAMLGAAAGGLVLLRILARRWREGDSDKKTAGEGVVSADASSVRRRGQPAEEEQARLVTPYGAKAAE